jgi:hypothetical protein
MELRRKQSEIALSNLTDNRHFARIPFRVPVRATIFPTYDGTGEAAKTCHVLANDISEGGVSIICSRPVRPGQRIELDMPDRKQNAIACRVVPVEGGRYLIGCQFEEVSAPQTVEISS